MTFLSSLQSRERIPELMDDPALDPSEHRLALEGLARVNRFTSSTGLLWPVIRDLAKGLNRPLRVLDVATGGGDVPGSLLTRGRNAGLPLEIAACDISPTAIATANLNCRDVRFFVHDAIREPLPAGFDVVLCSLFLHHLSAEDAIVVLGRMKDAAHHLVLVNDLARSRFNFLSVAMACRALSRSRVVRFDGPASVRSAFTPEEALAIAERAGFEGAKIQKRFPCRFLLSWYRK